MTALIITGSVLLLLLFLLLCPIRVVLSYKDGAFAAGLRYLFVAYNFSPEKMAKRTEKRAKRKIKSEDKKKAKKPKAKSGKSKSGLESAKAGWLLLKTSRHRLNRFRRHLVLSRVRIYASVGGEDAHQTAVLYAKLSATVTAALDILGMLFTVRTPKIGIAPDFRREQTAYDISLRIGIRPLFALMTGAGIFLSFIHGTAKNETTS